LRTIYCIGETVLDVILKDGIPLAVRPGGSMLNSSICLGRTGLPVHFITDFGMDKAGRLIHEFLADSGVDTRYADRYHDGKTVLALAFLDRSNNADYSFYRLFPRKRMRLLLPNVSQRDILLFGSHFSLDKEIRPKVLKFIRKARNNGALIIYDPNFRKPHLPELPKLRPFILENLSLADIVRGSDEDFNHIFGAQNSDEAYSKVSEAGCHILVYTKNKKGVEVICEKRKQAFKVPPLKVTSTIGAGDAFNAGLIYGLWALGGDKLTPEQGRWKVNPVCWAALVSLGISFAAEVCRGLDNYISKEFANTVKNGQVDLKVHS
jgi:fructokinase